MPVQCVVEICQKLKRSRDDPFFSFPAVRKNSTPENAWLISERLTLWKTVCGILVKLTKSMQICSRQFVSGKPANLNKPENIDWVPSLLLAYVEVPNETSDAQIVRCQEVAVDLKADSNSMLSITENDSRSDGPDGDNTIISQFTENLCVQTNATWIKDAEIEKRSRHKLEKENAKLTQTIEELRLKLAVAEESTRYTVTSLEMDDKKCKYITGIYSGHVLRKLYQEVKDDMKSKETYKEQMFVLALRKLRLNEPFSTLALIYNMHHSTIADRLFQVIHSKYPFMPGLIRLPPQKVIKAHMPLAFQKKYGNRVTIIIDCFEVMIESPKSEQMTANANMYSFYKHHKTIKVLADITPRWLLLLYFRSIRWSNF